MGHERFFSSIANMCLQQKPLNPERQELQRLLSIGCAPPTNFMNRKGQKEQFSLGCQLLLLCLMEGKTSEECQLNTARAEKNRRISITRDIA